MTNTVSIKNLGINPGAREWLVVHDSYTLNVTHTMGLSNAHPLGHWITCSRNGFIIIITFIIVILLYLIELFLYPTSLIYIIIL
jgi:hypothetical protein